MALKNIESIYPLSPMQESMLFYAQSRITAKQAGLNNALLTNDILFTQTNIDISGKIQLQAFKQAWQQIAIDNSAFRTGFLWEGLKQAQQFVRKQIELPYTFTDLSTESPQQQQNKLKEKMQADLDQGFDLNKAPLMRIQLIQLSSDTYRLIWSCHHLIIDRWCIPIVFEKLAQYYDALAQEQPLPIVKSPPFKRYIAWHHKQSTEKSEQFWRAKLANFSQSSRLCKSDSSAPQKKFEHFINPVLMEQINNRRLGLNKHHSIYHQKQ
jgi:hypothetical protein